MPSRTVSRHTPAAYCPSAAEYRAASTGMEPVDHSDHHDRMTTAEKTYDVIVLGAGAVGENVADITVRGGLRTVVVEAELVGGECSYWACMPSKALLRGTEALHEACAVSGAAAAVTGKQDVAATLARRDSFTSSWRDDGQGDWLRGAGIELVRGTGRLCAPKSVVVRQPDAMTELTLVARHAVVICTGSQAALPTIEGLADVRPWTSRAATSAQTAPGRLLIIGGGYVGCEMATAWHALGSTVTMLVRSVRLLPGLEPAAGEAGGGSLRTARVGVPPPAHGRPPPRGGAPVGAP